MDCIQCGERKGFRKATATARMARPRPPHAGGPAGPACLWARPMPRTPHHPRARRHPPPKDDCTRRPVAPAAILSIVLSAPSLPSCRAARRMPRAISELRSVFPYAEPSFLAPRWSSVQRLATAVALLQTERRRTPSGLASAAHVAFDRLASTSPIRPHVLLRS